MVTKLLPLVGREAEAAALEAQLRRARAGEFRCVVLVGEPGVGKSRLAAEVLRSQRRGAATLSARAYPLGQTTPFGLWAEALEGFLRSLTRGEVLALVDGVVDDLAGLLGSVASARGGAPAVEPPRVRVLAALAVVVRRLADATPLTIALDDVHQADASSWETLAYLARNLRDTRVLLIATARSTELAEGQLGSQILFGLEQEGMAERLKLAPLSPQGVGELVRAALDEPPPRELVAWIADRSRGNPLYALGLLQALVDEGADLGAPHLHAVPQPLAERIQARVRLLDEASLGVLETMALLGHRVVLGELARLSARPLDALAAALDTLVRSRLLVEEEQDHGLVYEIAHPLVQEAIYEGIGGARRVALHRQVARNLLASGFVGEAAPHFVRSAAVGDPEAIEALVTAIGQTEGRGAYREALALLNALVDLLPFGDERLLGVLDVVARPAEWVIDHRADAHAVLGIPAMRALDVMLERSDDAGRRAAVKFRLMSFLAWGTGELAEARRICGETIALFEQAGDRRGALLARNEGAWIEGLGGKWAATETAARAVREAAEAEGDLGVVMRADAAVGFSALWRGAFATGEEAFARSLAAARLEGKAYEVCRSLSGLAPLLALEGRVDEALLAVGEGRASGPDVRDSLLVEYGTIVHWLAGNYPAALASTREAVGVNLIGKRRAFGLVFGALSAGEMGRVDEGRRHLATASEAHRDGEWALFDDYCRFADAVLDRRAGGRIETRDLHRICLRILEWGMAPFAAFPLLELVEEAAEAGDVDVAREGATHLADLERLLDRRPYAGLSALGGALEALAEGASDAAAARARAACGLLSGTGMHAFEARGLDAVGRALSGTDPAGALVAFGHAARLFERCGAIWRRTRVLERLGRLGQAGRRTAAALAGPLPLTTRERQIARLAVRGSTSKEIAERLILSERTVETHLSHVYGKLGVRSKAELAARAADLDV